MFPGKQWAMLSRNFYQRCVSHILFHWDWSGVMICFVFRRLPGKVLIPRLRYPKKNSVQLPGLPILSGNVFPITIDEMKNGHIGDQPPRCFEPVHEQKKK